MKMGGYMQITLRVAPKKYRKTKVHLIILAAFVGPCPPGLECRHLDGNPANSRLDNLKWGTREENTEDRVRHGKKRGRRNGNTKLDELTVVAIRELATRRDENGMNYQDIADMFDTNRAVVGSICRGLNWKYAAGPRMKHARSGEGHVRAKLTEENVTKIRELIDSSGRHASVFRKLAQRYSVSPQAIRNIAYNHRWKQKSSTTAT